MEYQEQFIVDFARRTRANLEFIERAGKDGASVFEVTQLANSLLGLLVFPKERYIQSIPHTPLSELAAQGWPSVRTTQGQLREETLYGLIDMLRNSIAHCNVEFFSGPDSAISGIKVWNKYKGQISWKAELTIADLRSIAFKFVELIESGHAS